MPHALRLLSVLLLAAATVACGTQPVGGASRAGQGSSGTLAAFEAARDAVLPAASERRWEEIDWLPSYAVGLEAASAQQKPLMLWVMNGHPLGCT